MNEIDELGRKLCSLQGRIFVCSIDASACGSAVFVRRFMRSEAARRLDVAPAHIDPSTAEQLVEEVDAQFGGKPYGSEKYSANEMHWMGYVYRCLCLSTGMSSKAAHGIIGARELRLLYFPYHSLDAQQAVERILEARGAAQPKKSIEYGVARLREIRASVNQPPET